MKDKGISIEKLQQYLGEEVLEKKLLRDRLTEVLSQMHANKERQEEE